MENDDKIILRLPKEVKRNFKELCNKENKKMSNELRDFINKKLKPNGWDKINKQISESNLISKDMLDKCEITTYNSGKKINIGDNVLFGYLYNIEDDVSTMINFHVSEIDTIYSFYEQDTSSYLIPTIIKL